MGEFTILGDVVVAGSRILVPTTIASVLPGVVFPISGTVAATLPSTLTLAGGTVQQAPASYVFLSASGTVKGSPGVLYAIIASGESGLVAGPGTLLVLDGTATLAVIPVGAGGLQNPNFGPGVGFQNLIGSIIGSVDATFVVM